MAFLKIKDKCYLLISSLPFLFEYPKLQNIFRLLYRLFFFTPEKKHGSPVFEANYPS